jgi:hypothetical protein
MTSPYRWALTALRDLGLNVFGFLLMFAGAALLGVGVRSGMEKLVGRGHLWLALVFVALAAAGFVLGYAIPPRPDDLLSHLTDAYSWHCLDLLPGVGVNGALGWQCPVDLEGGRRGAPEASS